MLRAAVNNRAERSPLFLFHVSRDSQEDMDSTEFPRIASNFRDRATDLRGSKSERVNSASRKIYNWVELIDHACKCRINIKFPVYSIERRPIRIWYFVEKAIRGAHGRFVSLVATTFQVCVRIRDLSKPICPSWRRSIEVANVEASNLRRAFVTSFSTAPRNDKCLSTNPVFSLRTISRVLLGQKEKRSERGKE